MQISTYKRCAVHPYPTNALIIQPRIIFLIKKKVSVILYVNMREKNQWWERRWKSQRGVTLFMIPVERSNRADLSALIPSPAETQTWCSLIFLRLSASAGPQGPTGGPEQTHSAPKYNTRLRLISDMSFWHIFTFICHMPARGRAHWEGKIVKN